MITPAALGAEIPGMAAHCAGAKSQARRPVVGPAMSLLHIFLETIMLTTWRRKRGKTNLRVVFKLSSKALLQMEISAVVVIFY